MDVHVVLCVIFFVAIFTGAKCVIVRQVFDGVSDEIQRNVHVFLLSCVCACLYVRVFLLVCTLHSVAMVTTFFIRAIVVGLPPGSASHSLTFVKISQFHFFRICRDLGILWTSRQQTLQLLPEMIKKSLMTHARV